MDGLKMRLEFGRDLRGINFVLVIGKLGGLVVGV